MLELACTVAEPAVDVTYVFYEAEEVAAEHNGLRRLFAERPDLARRRRGPARRADRRRRSRPAARAPCGSSSTWCGERAHTARPWMGRNAIHRLAPVLERAGRRYEGRRPVIDGCEFREAMQAVRVEGGVAGNVVPDRVVLTVNHRFAPDRTRGRGRASTCARCWPRRSKPGDTFEVVDAAARRRAGLDHPVLAALIERDDLAVRAKLGWTDVARFAEHGIPAANFGPGDATLAHTAGERVEREPIERASTRPSRRCCATASERRPPGSSPVLRRARRAAYSRRSTVTTLPKTFTSSGREHHRLEPVVGRQEHDLAAPARERLDRGLVAGDAGDDDLAVVGLGLLAGDHVVAVEDAGVDHRVAPDPEHEQVALAREVGRDGQDLLDVLLGEHVGAGSDVADERHVADRAALGLRARLRVEPDLDGTGLGGVAPEVAEPLGASPGGCARWTAR